MRKRTRPRIGHDQRCRCARAIGTGRFYLGWEMCRLCGGFMVTDPDVRASLEAEERELEETEMQRASPKWRKDG